MFLILIGRIGQFLLAFAGIRLATTLLTPSEMGRMALVMAITSGFAMTLVNPVGMFINRRLHAWVTNNRASGYLALYWVYLAIVALLSGGIIYIGIAMGWIVIDVAFKWLVVLVCGSLFFNTINQTYIPSLNLLEHRQWFIGLTLATQGLGLVAALILVTVLSANAESWLLGILIGQMLIGLASMWVFEVYVGNRRVSFISTKVLSEKYLVTIFKFTWPVSIAVGLSWIQNQSYRFVLDDAKGVEQLGLFVAGYSISVGIMAAFESVLSAYFQPKFYKGINTTESAEWISAWNSYAAAIFPALIVTVLLVAGLANQLSQLLLGSSFQEASEFVLWGAMAEAARVIVGVYTLSAHAQMRTHSLLLPHAVGALLSLLLVWFLVPLLGGVGAGIALTMSGFLLVIVLNWQIRRQLAIEFPVSRSLLGVVAGIGLMLMSIMLEYVLRPFTGVITIAITFGVVGCLYLMVQYYLIWPMLEQA